MKIFQITDNFSVSGQLTVSDIKPLADMGIKLLMCNRPDGEETGQTNVQDIEAAAIENGMQFVNIPCSGTTIPEDLLDEFIHVVDNYQERIHAYCRTGNRCSIFWGLAHARTNSVQSIITQANDIGLNLTPVIDQIRKVHDRYS